MTKTLEERKAAKKAAQKKYREKNRARIVAKHKEYNDRTREQRAAKSKEQREKRRAELGLPPFVKPTQEQIKERKRRYSRERAARIRRENGIPIKVAMPIEELREKRRLQHAKAYKENPEHLRALKRKNATKTRIAKQLGVTTQEVPIEIFEVALLINSIKYIVRKNRENT